jgi:dephospho-CoA kinase
MTGFCLGLTGSIGMGKSTTAAMFAAEGVPVWDADQAVHRLYAAGGAAVAPLAALFPDAEMQGAIRRDVLRRRIGEDPAVLPRIEAVVHPLVVLDRVRFIAETPADILLLDVPLLFETGADTGMDASLVVTAPPALQRARVMARPGMTEALFQTLLAKQLPDRDKRARATHLIETLSLSSVRACVQALIGYIRENHDA